MVVKAALGASAMLDREGYMLSLLAERSEAPVPGVIHAEPGLLVMEHIPNDGRRSDSGMARLGDVLASLHAVTAERFGLERPTLIGPLDQPNTQTESWPEFYGRFRLQAMARQARDAGRLGADDARRIDRLCDRLDQLLDRPKPSLLHGDLWSGNVLWDAGDLGALIDPACSFGADEVDLAMMDLFGGFGPAFWERYDRARGIREGFWEQRRDLYTLYPLLVHVRLFGGSYADQARGILGRYA